MSKLASKEWWIDVAERAVSTAAETALTMITVGQAFVDVNWAFVASASGVAALVSVLKNLVLLKNKE